MSDVRFNFYPGVRNGAPAVSTIFQPTKQCGAIVASQSEVVVRKPRRSSGEREETKNGDVGRLRNSANPFENKPTSHFQLLDDFVRTICKHKKRNRVESPIETHCSRKDERRKSRRGRGHYQRAYTRFFGKDSEKRQLLQVEGKRIRETIDSLEVGG